MPGEKRGGPVAEEAQVAVDLIDGRHGRHVIGGPAEARVGGVARVRPAELVAEKSERRLGHDVGELKEEQLGGRDVQAVPKIDERAGGNAGGPHRAAGERCLEAGLGAGGEHLDGALRGWLLVEREALERDEPRAPAALGARIGCGEVATRDGKPAR